MKRLQENNKLFPHEKSQLQVRDQSFVCLSCGLILHLIGSYTIGNVKIKSKRSWYFDSCSNFQAELLVFVGEHFDFQPACPSQFEYETNVYWHWEASRF